MRGVTRTTTHEKIQYARLNGFDFFFLLDFADTSVKKKKNARARGFLSIKNIHVDV